MHSARELLPWHDLEELPLRERTWVLFRDGRQVDRACILVSTPARVCTV